MGISMEIHQLHGISWHHGSFSGQVWLLVFWSLILSQKSSVSGMCTYILYITVLLNVSCI